MCHMVRDANGCRAQTAVQQVSGHGRHGCSSAKVSKCATHGAASPLQLALHGFMNAEMDGLNGWMLRWHKDSTCIFYFLLLTTMNKIEIEF